MKIFKSIKWRLQLWYGLILVVVLAGFGFTAYQLERGRQFRHLDDELHRRIDILASNLHHPPPQEGNGDDQFSNRPPPQDQFPGDGPMQPQRHPPVFHLAPENSRLFDTNDINGFFFKIWRPVEGDNTIVAQSENYPQSNAAGPAYDHYFAEWNHYDLPDRRKFTPPKTFQFGDEQSVIQILPSSEAIEVGCSLKPLHAELRSTMLHLAGVGGLILLVGLAGGWWLVSLALKPIEAISATAAKISAGDLAQRINVAEAESELGQLAAVLNSTFARLETAFVQQKQFAADAAHELRTPVAVMLTQTQTALNRERSAPEYRDTVAACQRAAQRMRRLIESLLALARFDAGQEILRRQPFDLAQTVAECADLVQPLAAERGVKITVESRPLQIMGDAERLAQVVTNLLTNGIQFNQPGGEVRAQLETRDSLAVLTVSDTGQGIAAENLPRVFGRFFRAEQSRTGAGNAGLGLAICQAIVAAHGGTIDVVSAAGAGTTFTVRLPLGV